MNDRQWLNMVVGFGLSFRDTPIVDDDFPGQRDRFDTVLRDAEEFLKTPRPKIVTLCGSTRFKEEYQREYTRLGEEGCIVLSVCRFGHKDGLDMDGDLKKRLDELHLRKIDLSDEIFVINANLWQCKKCGKFWELIKGSSLEPACICWPRDYHARPYIGESTRREIAYAESKGITVTYLNPPGE